MNRSLTRELWRQGNRKPASENLAALFQGNRAQRRKGRDQFLRQTYERLRINTNENDAHERSYQSSLQCRREGEGFFVRNAVAEVHHLDKAHIVIEGHDSIKNGPPCEPVVPGFSIRLTTLQQTTE